MDIESEYVHTYHLLFVFAIMLSGHVGNPTLSHERAETGWLITRESKYKVYGVSQIERFFCNFSSFD